MNPIIFIPLTQGKVAVIDFADREGIVEHRWHTFHIGRRFYVRRTIWDSMARKCRPIYLHREIMKAKPGEQVDHIDGDGLNDTRENMRIVTNSQNQQAFQHKMAGASSKFRGVSWSRWHQKWEVSIQKDKQRTRLGHFDSEENAARAYDKAAIELFGEFAQPNFLK